VPKESLITVKELANRLNVHSKTIYKWAHEGKIPCVKIGYLLRFKPEAVEQFIKEREINSRLSAT
jgi:excisionase family DNA binding protein